MRNWAGLLAIAAALAITAPAQAAPVASWNYSISFAFTDADYTPGIGTPFTSPFELSWGTTGGSFEVPDGDRSALTIGTDATNLTGGGVVNGTVTTNALTLPGIGLSNTITHWNSPISSTFATLTGGQITSSLALESDGGIAVPGLPDLVFDFLFVETLHNPPGNPGCAENTAEPCADIFVLVSSTAFNVPCTFDGIDYLISIFPFDAGGMLGSIATLGAEQCEAAGAAPGCVGIITNEDEATTIQFAFAITTEPLLVPEPGMLGLLALGLFGLALVRRSRAD